MKFELLMSAQEKIVQQWCYASSAVKGSRISNTLYVTNKRLIVEKKGNKYIEKVELPIDSIESVSCSFGQKGSKLLGWGIALFIVGAVLAALSFINKIPNLPASPVFDYLPYVLYAGAGIAGIGLILLLIALFCNKQKTINISITQNHVEYNQYNIAQTTKKYDHEKVSLELDANINKCAVEIINGLSALIIDLQESNRRKNQPAAVQTARPQVMQTKPNYSAQPVNYTPGATAVYNNSAHLAPKRNLSAAEQSADNKNARPAAQNAAQPVRQQPKPGESVKPSSDAGNKPYRQM